jgi:hypothetical protein
VSSIVAKILHSSSDRKIYRQKHMVFCIENTMYFFSVCFGMHWTLAIVIPTCGDDNNIVLNMTYIDSLSDPLTWQ